MSSSTQKLTGKIALVTGASKGIGASIAKHLAAAGATVVVNYASSRAGADQVVSEITAAGGQAIAIQADVSKPVDITRLLAATKTAFGRLDILVNNAGIYELAPLEAVTPENFRRHFDLNVLGLLLVTQAAVPLFPEGGGSIINLGSIVSSITPPGTAVYTGTKGAVDAITGVLANELGPKKIRVNAINPGIVETEGTHTAGLIGSAFEQYALTRTPLGRTGQPADIAKVAVLLASDEAGWLTGEIIRTGGGLR